MCGEKVRPRAAWLQRLGQLVADNWYVAPAAVCPNCGYPAALQQRRAPLRRLFAGVHRLVGLFRTPRPTEFAALLARRSA
jgi:hypothetical protein